MKKLLLVVALVVMSACGKNGSNPEATDPHEVAVPKAQVEDVEMSNAALTAANMKSAAVAQTAALSGAEVGCAALAQMAALAQAAAQSGGVVRDASWLAGWKVVHDL